MSPETSESATTHILMLHVEKMFLSKFMADNKQEEEVHTRYQVYKQLYTNTENQPSRQADTHESS